MWSVRLRDASREAPPERTHRSAAVVEFLVHCSPHLRGGSPSTPLGAGHGRLLPARAGLVQRSPPRPGLEALRLLSQVRGAAGRDVGRSFLALSTRTGSGPISVQPRRPGPRPPVGRPPTCRFTRVADFEHRGPARLRGSCARTREGSGSISVDLARRGRSVRWTRACLFDALRSMAPGRTECGTSAPPVRLPRREDGPALPIRGAAARRRRGRGGGRGGGRRRG